LRQAELDKEQQALTAERDRQTQSAIQKYTALIKQKVERNWRKPATANPGMSCTVFVRLIPGGDVAHVEITKSSGDGIFDSSVEKAVYKAVPLPVPPDPSLFDKFRDVRFVFKPEQ
jgi:colicin import membrane protein